MNAEKGALKGSAPELYRAGPLPCREAALWMQVPASKAPSGLMDREAKR